MTPLGRLVGVDLRLEAALSLGRKPRDADFVRRRRLERPGVEESMLTGVAVPESRRLISDVLVFSLNPTTLIVGVDGLCGSCFARPGVCASICIGSGTPDLTHGLTV